MDVNDVVINISEFIELKPVCGGVHPLRYFTAPRKERERRNDHSNTKLLKYTKCPRVQVSHSFCEQFAMLKPVIQTINVVARTSSPPGF